MAEDKKQMKYLLRPTIHQLEDRATDIKDPQAVDIVIDPTGSRIWVNIDGLCILRISNPVMFELEDTRK